jgi:hypothetical protein
MLANSQKRMSQDTPQLLADELIQLKERIVLIEGEIAAIHNRNRRVESNKTWETGRFRLLSITAITYVTMVLVFVVLGSNRPFLDALVPTTGFFLSTLSLSFLRDRIQRP